MRRHGHGPNWWPEGEQWPPKGGPGQEAWSGAGRKMLGAAIAFLTFITFVAVLVGTVIATVMSGVSAGSKWPTVVGTVILAFFGLNIMKRIFRRTWRPVRSLIDTAGRLADGDYSARADVRSSPSMRAVGSSFNTMAERLETADEQRRRLMSDLGHELRTPLAIIRGEIEAVIDGVRDGGPEHMASLLDEVAVMERLIEDLRVLSMSEAGKLELQTELGDLLSIVNEVASSYRPTAAASGVEILVAAPDGPPPVELDPVRIRQALTNLVVNALRAMPSGGTLTIELHVEPVRMTVDVTDTGAGISPELLPHVFDRFTKSDDSGGSGLGLSIARSFVTAHGGDLEIVSTGPSGTRVSLSLPR
ncbi:MAG: HAMP domain-containing histidine kinase [Acidimicrobiia bacterium]|nr:HAMP domain-containing histidine kinase [Acidimicrobiia bacterium]